MLQESQPEPGLTVRECLELYAGLLRGAARRSTETIALVGLEEKADTLGEQLSGGQRRRLDVALALIGDPELIFLDEPTTGFDPSARRAAWDVVAGLRELGKTVFLTTHYMDEAENLADRIAVIAGGRIVAEGTPRTLGGRERMAGDDPFTLPDGHRPRRLAAGLPALARRGRTAGRPRERAAARRRRRARRLGARARARPARSRRAPAVPRGRLPAADRRRAGRVPRRAAGGSGLEPSTAARRCTRRATTCSRFLRNRQARFFTLILPVLFLVIFVSVFGNHRVGPEHVKASTYYVPGISALGDHRRLVRQPRHLGDRPAGGGRAQAPPRDAGAGLGADRRPGADGDRRLARRHDACCC